MKNIKGLTALVTGGSVGIGAAIATELASKGCNLILVARRTEKLEEVRERILKSHAVEIDLMTADLTDSEARTALYNQIETAGKTVDVLVNNAGVGVVGLSKDISWEREQFMYELNIMALTHLTKLFVPAMIERKNGYVMQLASVAGFMPIPSFAGYSATKHFVLAYAEAIDFELKGTGVSMTTVCPGSTTTEFFEVSRNGGKGIQDPAAMSAESVARIGVDALFNRKRTVVTGLRNRVMAVASRYFTPRKMATAVAALVMKKNGATH